MCYVYLSKTSIIATGMLGKLLLITPLRDEAQNIPRIESTLKAQTVPVDAWIIVENGSTDGSKELIRKLRPSGAIRSIVVLNFEHAIGEYALGTKYASVVEHGMSHVKRTIGIADDDYVGILDADTFPRPDYYALLLAAMRADPFLGITSGHTVDKNGHPTIIRQSFVKGSCRVWRGACLKQAGYIVAPSADVLSAAKATIRGWQVRVTPGAVAQARQQGDRVDYSYYGHSAYYRGETLLHCLLRILALLLRLHLARACRFGSGYLADYVRGAPRIVDPEIRAYFRGAVGRLLLERWSGLIRWLPMTPK
jgi:glycosyltransferase involved in cell wall biosynthesis